jgi:hypothetical protein
MKSLSDYTDDTLSQLFQRLGAFYAFGNRQFEEQRVKDTKYTSLGMGLICPTENCDELRESMSSLVQNAIAARIKEYGLEAIIRYELSNYESYYTGCIDNAFEALQAYGAKREEVLRVFREQRHLQRADD